jgi:predicted kinase
MLVIFSGLPATGKTTIAKRLSRRINAVYLRIDSIEQALRNSEEARFQGDMGPIGYQVAYALAADNLTLGRAVIVDSVNPLNITRDAWRQVALDSQSLFVEVEIVCSDQTAHRSRVESRKSDVDGLVLSDWSAVIHRKYEPWPRERLVIDTALLSAEQAVDAIVKKLPKYLQK